MTKFQSLLTVLSLGVFSPLIVFQSHAGNSQSELELTIDVGYYEYEETVGGSFFMSDEADPAFVSVGIRKWESANSDNFSFLYTAEFTYGATEYKGSGTLTKDYYKARFEGYLSFLEDGKFKPFFGLGYRWLYDDSGGLISSTGAYGYDRRSQYLYAPIGFTFALNENISFRGQYNLFLHGSQTSYLSDVASCTDLTNDQNGGFGLDFVGNFKLNKNSSLFAYYRSWDINKSEISTATCGTSLTIYGYEPENETIEYGIGYAHRF